MHTIKQSPLGSLKVERSGVPIYLQLREQVLAAMAAGVLKPGDQMPTMRQLAVALRVDLNTVRRTYEELERLGVLVLIHGRGSFVADPLAALPGETRLTQTHSLARQTLAAAAALGVDPEALVACIRDLTGHTETP
jgi:GntR family transcriptional regulator